MANPIEYIVYEPDQVLTNDHLNETFNYLDQQNRWTRNKLIGIGIVCGLEVVLNTGVIGITKGCGVTSQGYLITQDATQYTYYMPYAAIAVPNDLPFTYDKPGGLPFYKPFCDGKSVWLLLSDAQYAALETAQQLTAKTLSSAAANFLGDYVVALFLEASETDLKNCDMQDCNNKGEKMVMQVKPLLVAKKDLPGTAVKTIPLEGTPGRLVTNITPQVSLKRYNVPYTTLNNSDDVINAFVKLVDDNTLAQVANALSYSYTRYSAALKVNANPFTTLAADLKSYRDLILKQNPVFIEYFYDFIDDLIKAYNEFSFKVSDVISTCCPDENLFPLHLVLGSASAATNSLVKDSYRNYFIYSPLFAKMGTESAEVILLFKRMMLMVKDFIAQTQNITRLSTIKVTPSQYELPWLSERAIPYYYNVNVAGSELYKAWNYYKTINGFATLNLGYNANLYNTNTAVTQPLLYDIEKYNFFRVEGHIGQNYQKVLSNLLTQRQNYNLPIDVVAISADLLTSGAVLPDCNFLDLETGYKLIRSEAACKIHTTFCFITKMPYTPPATKPVFGRQFDTGSLTLVNKENIVADAHTVMTAKAAKSQEAALPSGISEQQATPGAAAAAAGATIDTSNTIDFSTFKLNLAATLEPVLTFANAYKKGDFMNTYCVPLANTIGSAYLSALDSNGVFTNPIQIDQSNPLTIVYYYFFQYVDAVEQMMYVLQTNKLETIDMTAFGTEYLGYLGITALTISFLTLMAEQAAATPGAVATPYVTLVEDLQLNLLVSELDVLTSMCIDERLQVLKDEYTRRLTQYQQQNTFLNYYKNHTGLEHKAGVPKGGTLVLVYHSATQAVDTTPLVRSPIADTPVATIPVDTTPVAAAPVAAPPAAAPVAAQPPGEIKQVTTEKPVGQPVFKEPVKTGTVFEKRAIAAGQTDAKPALSEILANAPTLTDKVPVSGMVKDPQSLNDLKTLVGTMQASDAQKQLLLGLLAGQAAQPKQPQYPVADGAVIADFYIPYLCCSDCPPMAYILPVEKTPPPVQQKPVVTIANKFCDNDTNATQIKVSVSGGIFNAVKGLDNIKQTFTPSLAGAGTYAIVYTAGGLSSDPVSVTVLPTPVNTFTFASLFTEKRDIQVTFTPDSQDTGFKYDWKFGPGFSVKESNDEVPVVLASFDQATGGQVESFVTLQVSNGNCGQEAVTLKLLISPNGVFDPNANAGGIKGNLQKLFTKKKKK